MVELVQQHSAFRTPRPWPAPVLSLPNLQPSPSCPQCPTKPPSRSLSPFLREEVFSSGTCAERKDGHLSDWVDKMMRG
jgi:hypothetical protein